MKRRLIATTAVVGAAAVVLAALAAGERGDAVSPAGKPRLSVSLTPLVVAGSGFRAGELVRVTVRGSAVASSGRDKASASGHISVRLSGLRLDECSGFLIVTAKGDKGSSAQLRRMPSACGIDPGRAP